MGDSCEKNPSLYHRAKLDWKSDPPRERHFAEEKVWYATRAVKGKLAALVLRTLDSTSGEPGEGDYGEVRNCN